MSHYYDENYNKLRQDLGLTTKENKMASFNQVTLLGNLGKDPELTTTPSGVNICKFSIATTKKTKGEDKTTWHNIVTFNKTADNCNQYLKKGSSVLITGEIDNSSYEKDGVTKYFSSVNAFNVQFLNGNKEVNQALKENNIDQSSSNFAADDIGF